MRHYKDSNNTIYAYEADGSQDTYIKNDLVQITDEEAEAIRISQLPVLDPQVAINQEALAYLASTDWIVTKIAEVQLLGGDVEPLKTKYALELLTRSDKRALIV